MKVLLVLLAIVGATFAAQPQSLFFGGLFSVGDPFCHYCPSSNIFSEGGVGCECPAGFEAYPARPESVAPFKLQAPSNGPLLRISSSCAANGAQWHSSLSMCIASPARYAHNTSNLASPSLTTAPQFAGFYQRVDNACRVVNPLTGDCSCPSDSESIVIKHSVPRASSPVVFSAEGLLHGEGDVVTTGELVMCGRRASLAEKTVNFAGAFTTRRDGSCADSNPFTDACTCPINSQSSTSTIIGSDGTPLTLNVCGPRVTRNPNAQICDGVSADSSGTTDAGPAFNQCFMMKREIRLPLGIYLINTGLKTDGGRIEAQNFFGQTCLVSSAPCPVVKAGPSLVGPLFQGRADMYNTVFDGNRLGRLSQIGGCAINNTIGYTIVQRSAPSAGGFQMQGCAVINALCGAGLFSQIGGGFFSGAQVQSSLFSGNGDHNDAAKTYAHGILVGMGSNGFQAQQNYYVDNTDCHVGVDEPTSSVEVEQSTLTQQAAQAFCALRYSWAVSVYSPTPYDYTPSNWGNQFQQTTINCNGKCYFGIQIGGRPWSASSPVVQGQGIEVEENTVTGAVVGINWDAGIGRLQQNNYGAILGRFNKCSNMGALLNISPESRVDRSSESQPPATHTTYAGCVP